MSTRAITGCTECGWKSKLTTPAYAEKAYRLHSCEKKRREDELTVRSRARDAAVDRTPKPCAHLRTTHQHGTYACYVLDFCRCLPCAAANSNYESERVRNLAYGRTPYVDAGPAREHVRSLMAAGMGWKRVGQIARVANGTMTKLLYGDSTRGQEPSKRIRPDAAKRLLAVQLELADGKVVDGTGTRRRLQALVVAGWPQARLASRLGMLPSNFGPVFHGQRQPTAATARAIAALYDELWNVAPTAANGYELGGIRRALRYAASRGWAPALAWDEDTIDDPMAAPVLEVESEGHGIDEVAVLRRAGGDRSVDLTRAERWVLVRRLHRQGLNDRQIARRTGLVDRQVIRDRQQLGLPPNTEGRATPGREDRVS